MARKNDFYYFDGFIKLTEYCYSAAKLLDDTLKNFNKDTLQKNMKSMHDIGQTAVQGEMLKEKSADTGEELRISAEDHPSLGADMLPDSGIFQDIRKGIKHHHERYDGSGYPDGLERTEIPFIARIIAVADVFDAMTMLCAEEEKLQCRQAIREIRKGSGSFFDPLVVVALTDLEEEIVMLFQDSSLDRKLEATAEGS